MHIYTHAYNIIFFTNVLCCFSHVHNYIHGISTLSKDNFSVKVVTIVAIVTATTQQLGKTCICCMVTFQLIDCYNCVSA